VTATEAWVFVSAVVALAALMLWAQWYIVKRGNRRDRIDREAHEAYMNGGGYPAYYAVYRKYGIIKKGK